MARTRPIPAEQPLDAAWKAAGQVVTLRQAPRRWPCRRWPCRRQPPSRWPQCCGRRSPQPTQWSAWPARWAHGCRCARSRTSRWSVVMPGSGGAGRGAKVPGGPSGAVRAAGAITLGVEEEFVLLDPSTGVTVPAGPDLVRMLDGEPGVQQELMQFQVETGTRVCTGLDDLGGELVRLRRLAAAAAAHLGCRLVASGVAPYRTPGLAALTCQPRYYELARRYGPVVAEAGICACHVHVGVPSRDLGVQVLARLRPWLAPLLAVTANSPIADGHDTGWASWRYTIQTRWPTAVPPAAWPDAAAYDTAVRRLIGQRRGAGRAERLLPGPAFPALPDRRGPGRRRLPRRRHRGAAGGADPRPGRHRPGRGPAGDAGGNGAGRAGRRGAGRCGASGARRGRSRPVHRAGRRCAGAPLPPP